MKFYPLLLLSLSCVSLSSDKSRVTDKIRDPNIPMPYGTVLNTRNVRESQPVVTLSQLPVTTQEDDDFVTCCCFFKMKSIPFACLRACLK